MKLFAAVLLLLATCFSTTIIPRSVEELTRDSSDVIVGRAGQPRAIWNAAHSMIYTLTPVTIERTLKGGSKRQVMISQMGGRLDGIETKVAGVRQFQADERAALFLRPSEDMPGTYFVTGLMQGRFTIAIRDGQEVVSNGVQGVEVLDRATQTIGEFHGAEMTLRQLESRVRKAVDK